jgi:hypothetical protein
MNLQNLKHIPANMINTELTYIKNNKIIAKLWQTLWIWNFLMFTSLLSTGI